MAETEAHSRVRGCIESGVHDAIVSEGAARLGIVVAELRVEFADDLPGKALSATHKKLRWAAYEARRQDLTAQLTREVATLITKGFNGDESVMDKGMASSHPSAGEANAARARAQKAAAARERYARQLRTIRERHAAAAAAQRAVQDAMIANDEDRRRKQERLDRERREDVMRAQLAREAERERRAHAEAVSAAERDRELEGAMERSTQSAARALEEKRKHAASLAAAADAKIAAASLARAARERARLAEAQRRREEEEAKAKQHEAQRREEQRVRCAPAFVRDALLTGLPTAHAFLPRPLLLDRRSASAGTRMPRAAGPRSRKRA